MTMKVRRKYARFFWDNVSKEPHATGCWLWMGGRDKNGYGYYCSGGSVRCAHRVAYEQLVGTIPEGLHIDHLCRNPSCVNPEHMEPVTLLENLQRGRDRAAADKAFR